jgi:hypothetical protein
MATPSALFSSLQHADEFDPVAGATVTQPDLIREGWTKSVITKMLGSPDFTRRRQGGGTFNYYLVERVEAVKASSEFAALIAKSEARKATAPKALATRIANMEHFVRMAEITIVPDKATHEIERLAIHMHVANHAVSPRRFHWNNRVARDCIRHTLTNYESLWAHIERGCPGQRAYEILRARVDWLVAKTYPQFASD